MESDMMTNIKLHALYSAFKSIMYKEFENNMDVLRKKTFDEAFSIFIDDVSERLARNQLNDWPEHIRKKRDMNMKVARNIIDNLVKYDMEE